MFSQTCGVMRPASLLAVTPLCYQHTDHRRRAAEPQRAYQPGTTDNWLSFPKNRPKSGDDPRVADKPTINGLTGIVHVNSRMSPRSFWFPARSFYRLRQADPSGDPNASRDIAFLYSAYESRLGRSMCGDGEEFGQPIPGKESPWQW